MKQVIFAIVLAALTALFLYIVATDVDVEKMEQEQMKLAEDCYNMNYEMEVCR